MIAVGSDHGGLALKEAVKSALATRGLEVDDYGTDNGDSVDYPDFAEKVAGAVSRTEAELGILVCGTGIGMSIVANKYPGVRAALVTDVFMAQMAKEHKYANVLVLGGRLLDEDMDVYMVNVWLDSRYEAGRNKRRLDKISRLEEDVRAGKF